MRHLWRTGFGLLVALLLSTAAAAESGVFVEVRASDAADAPEVERWRLYGASHSLVIGIDSYTNSWPRLSNAVKDDSLVGPLVPRQYAQLLLAQADEPIGQVETVAACTVAS